VTASDNQGGSGNTTVPVTVVASTNHVPTVTAGRTPTGTITSGTAVNFTAAGTDTDGDTLSYTWDFGDGTPGSTAQNPTHTYTATGTFAAKVTVNDGKGGNNNDTLSVTVVAPNQNPTVSITRNPTGNVTTGTSVAFTATATDPDGDPLTYAWDFGDGGTSTQQNPSHPYSTAGTYSAKVVVSDGHNGTATSNPLSITVTPGGSCPPGFRDDFNGTALDASWTVLRPDATDGGIVVGGGTAAIPTGTGDIYQTTNTGTNFVLRTAPSGAFTVTA
jgi:PKD repeat protein